MGFSIDPKDDSSSLVGSIFWFIIKCAFNSLKFGMFIALFISFSMTSYCHNAVWDACEFVRLCDKY